jgi:hypothetical protein
MGVFKEHAHAFEAVAQKQRCIFKDAADYGCPYNTNNPPEDIALLIAFVNDLKGTSLQRTREEWTGGVKTTIRIGWEIDEGMECGTQYIISYNFLGKRYANSSNFLCHGCNAFISVDISSYRESVKK